MQIYPESPQHAFLKSKTCSWLHNNGDLLCSFNGKIQQNSSYTLLDLTHNLVLFEGLISTQAPGSTLSNTTILEEAMI